MISIGSLVAAGIGPTQARLFEAPMQQACEVFELNTPQRLAAFVAQCAHESGLFIHLEENLYYSDALRLMRIFPSSVKSLGQAAGLVRNPQELANTVYANRLGNGPAGSGDGYRYRGRGLIQLTGRANYTAAALELHEPYIDQPEIVAQPADACLTAGWFWRRGRCNELADANDIDGITRAINGAGMAGRDERRDLYTQALVAFA